MTAIVPSRIAYGFRRLASACRPRERLSVSGWADRFRILSGKQSGERGRWRTARNPVLREIMDVLSVFSTVAEIVVMKSSQRGVSEMVVNWIGYIIDHAPAPAMVFMPTLESRDSWKIQKLNPLFTETDKVRQIMGGMRSRDAANSKETIDYPGGVLFLAGGNSPNSYDQKTVKFEVMDDLDRFPQEVGKEGDPVMLARGRTKAMARSKILFISTPTIKGASLIEREFEDSDQREYEVPCPACGEYQALKWPNMGWSMGGAQVWYGCAHCGYAIEEHHKPRMLAAGRWVPRNPGNKRRGYHINALTAPIGLGPSWPELVSEFLVAKESPVTLKTFVNTHLGETWEDQTHQLKPHDLAKRAEPDVNHGVIPPGVLALTCGIDTQDSWLSVTLLGWGRGNRFRILENFDILGDTARDRPWNELQDYLHAPRVNAYGKHMRIRAAGIDMRGHRGAEVRAFAARPQLRIPVYAVIGSTSRLPREIRQTPGHSEKSRTGKAVRGGVAHWEIGTEVCKDFIYGQLAADGELAIEDRTFRFPAGLPEEYWYGLMSEVFDPAKNRYKHRLGAKYKRNEPLDTLVIAYAIGHHREVKIGRDRRGRQSERYWDQMEAQLEPSETTQPQAEESTTEPPEPAQRKRRAKRRSKTGMGRDGWEL